MAMARACSKYFLYDGWSGSVDLLLGRRSCSLGGRSLSCLWMLLLAYRPLLLAEIARQSLS